MRGLAISVGVKAIVWWIRTSFNTQIMGHRASVNLSGISALGRTEFHDLPIQLLDFSL
jgi:hypothetical protein